MISLNAQIGVNPLINHQPKRLYSHKLCNNQFTIGQNGQIVGWKNKQPIFLMCPSLNAEADKLLCLTSAQIRDIDQVNQTIKIITLHNDNRLRIWTESDGICINVSIPALFPEKIIHLIAPQIQCRFIIALAQQVFYIVDCWMLKILSKITPKKEAYARFKYAQMTQKLVLEIYDGSNRAYNYNLQSLFSQGFLDFGNELNDFNKTINQIQSICTTISKVQVSSYYKRLDGVQPKNMVPQEYEHILNAIKQESLTEILFNPEIIKDYPQLSSLFQEEQASISDLHYIGGTSLYFFIGTKKGTIFGIPISIRSDESLVIVKDTRKQGSSVQYIRIFNSILFISWSDGSLGIYSVKNLSSQLQIVKINKFLEYKEKQDKKIVIFTMDLTKLVLLQQKLSSFMKYSLPVYDCIQGKLKNSYFFRLDRNQIISFDENTNEISHFRGISEDAKVYCIFLINEYVGICTSNGIELYSPYSYERTINYIDWIWQDYKFLQPNPNQTQYRNSDYHDYINNANSIMKFNCRWAFDKLNYTLNGQQIFNETFTTVDMITNEQFANYYFVQRGQVKKALHSRSSENNAIVIKMKMNRIRKDSWNNAAYLINANLNLQLDEFQGFKGTPHEILMKDYQFYMLLPCNDLHVPFISNQIKNIGKRSCLKKRQAIQGVGKTFTIYFSGSHRIKLSEKLLINQAVSTIALLHCWVSKDNEATDYMIQAAQYFSQVSSTLYGEGGDIILARLAVSSCQHISKASINLLILKAITGQFKMHPIFEYFTLGVNLRQNDKRLLSYNETVWLVYLGLGLIFSGKTIEREQVKKIVLRLIHCISDLNNFDRKPYYTLTVMRVFNEGVNSWKSYMESNDIVSKLLIQLFKIFFYYDAIPTITGDDKKFNFVFAKNDEAFRKTMKQGIIRTIIYIGNTFQHDFHTALKNETVSQKIHANYPASVIEILRQYIKSQKPSTNLVFYVELLLQCLSPMTPQLRKYVQKNALATLQLMCTYKNISFNQPSQKLSVKTSNHLYIYCLRTSTKWRTINLKDQKSFSGEALVQMSPNGTYIALLSDKLRIWRLSSGFWSGVLGAFSQDWVFEAAGKALKWSQNQESITVIHQLSSKNKVFKI